MKIVKYIAAVVVLIGGGLWYFHYFAKPEDTIATFAESINHSNVTQLVDLIDPEQTKELRTMLKLANTFSDEASDIDIEDDILPLLPILTDYVATDVDGSMPNVTFTHANTDMNLLRTKATVTVDTTFHYQEEIKEAKEIFQLEKIHRKWHIMDIQSDR